MGEIFDQVAKGSMDIVVERFIREMWAKRLRRKG
jgi:hypothetical protein